MQKQFVALARVSSREQEREGFSLEVQEEALLRYAEQHDGVISKLFRIAETATKPDERRTFKELLTYAKKNAGRIAAVLFFKVDRAARNLFDYVELERLENDFGVEVVYVTQPTENTPAGRMMRRTLANMASFYTEQQSLDVKDGLLRRVQSGLFVGKAPYGYLNVRRAGRSLVEIDEKNAQTVRRIFELYAHHGHTIDSLILQLKEEGTIYRDSQPRFSRSKIHAILTDRAYIGEVSYHSQWYPGIHAPLVERGTFDRVQVLLGGLKYQSHGSLYAGGLIRCGHCGGWITGEVKTKQTKSGQRHYTYYRCTKYNRKEHPRVRVRETAIDEQALAMFDSIRIDDEDVRDWFLRVIHAKNRESQDETRDRISELNRQLSSLRSQQDELLNLRILKEIDESTFARKNTELRDRIAKLTIDIEAIDRTKQEHGDIAVRAFELSQTLKEKWVNADNAAKRRLLEIVCLNYSLDDVTLVYEMRKPFDVLAKGPISKQSRGDRI